MPWLIEQARFVVAPACNKLLLLVYSVVKLSVSPVSLFRPVVLCITRVGVTHTHCTEFLFASYIPHPTVLQLPGLETPCWGIVGPVVNEQSMVQTSYSLTRCEYNGGWSLNPTHSPVGFLIDTSSAGGDLGNACAP